MALTTRFLPHSVYLSFGTPTWINQIESTSADGGIALFEESTGSETERAFVAAKEIAPTLPINTSDLSILSTIGFAGLPFATPGVIVYGRELPFGSLPTSIATGAHIKLTVTDGMLVPVGLRASHNQVAKLSLILHGILGTGAAPFVFTVNQAITSGAGGTSNIYTTGPIKYTAGTSRLVQGIRDINVQFGIQVFKEGDSGDVFPSAIAIIARMSRIEFTTADAELASEVGDGLSTTAFASYFRQVAANGQRVAPNVTTHVSVIGTTGMITRGAMTLAHKQPGETSFTYTPTSATACLAVSATAAIPTT